MQNDDNQNAPATMAPATMAPAATAPADRFYALTEAKWQYDPDLVCAGCGTNDYLHYNLTLFHGEQWLEPHEDPWCGRCSAHSESLMTPAQFKRAQTCT